MMNQQQFLCCLRDKGFIVRPNPYECSDGVELGDIMAKPYVVFDMPGIETFPEAVFLRDYEVFVSGYDRQAEMDDFLGCLWCGGLFTFVRAFRNGVADNLEGVIPDPADPVISD